MIYYYMLLQLLEQKRIGLGQTLYDVIADEIYEELIVEIKKLMSDEINNMVAVIGEPVNM